MKYPVSLARLGEDYEWPSIYQRIYESPLPRPYAPISVSHYRMRFRGSFGKARKITGLRALYYHYLYKMGILPEHKQHKAFSPEMREALRRLDRYSEQARLLAKYKLDTPEQVPLKHIQEWLGHSDFSTTANIYAHLDYSAKLTSAQAMVEGVNLPSSQFSSKWSDISDEDFADTDE